MLENFRANVLKERFSKTGSIINISLYASKKEAYILVPRVSHFSTPWRYIRDPGNEVEKRIET